MMNRTNNKFTYLIQLFEYIRNEQENKFTLCKCKIQTAIINRTITAHTVIGWPINWSDVVDALYV